MSVADELQITAGVETFIDESALGQFDRFVSRIGDWLNPILVKETRQALKSRQFTISFWLVLTFAVGWSFVGITLQLPQIYYLPSGASMLVGYFLILCVPLLLVVPFSAYRSLAMEREDGTYELLSITSLSARQIVTGKLGSALVQIMVYYAALAPCIGFTYLLRGLDIGTIFVLLIGTFLVSVLLSTIGLVFAGAARSRQWQALTSVILLLLLLACGWGWCFVMIQMVTQGGGEIYQADFAEGAGLTLTMYATFMAMFIFLAAAQNSFVTDNRSTKLRVTMLVQQLCFAGWMTYLWLENKQPGFLIALPFVSGIAWVLYGALMTGEVAELSPRARRDLPQSFFGRAFLSWFNPGPSTGYALAVLTYLAVVLYSIQLNILASIRQPELANDLIDTIPLLAMFWFYATIYLGLGRLAILGLRRLSDFGLAAAVMIHVLVMTAGCAVPYFIGFWHNEFRSVRYSQLQTSNWLWTLSEASDKAWSIPFKIGIPEFTGTIVVPMVTVVGFFALVVLGINFAVAAREIEATRLETPDRIRLDSEANTT